MQESHGQYMDRSISRDWVEYVLVVLGCEALNWFNVNDKWVG